MNMKRTVLVLSALGLLGTGLAVQAMPHHDASGVPACCDAGADPVGHMGHMGHAMGGMSGMNPHAMMMSGMSEADLAKLTPMQQELMQGMNQMHGAMHDGMTHKNPDAAFSAGMIPHHQGAIAMAEVQLKYGKDPEMRKLAQAIIDAQGPEIARMNDWIIKHPNAMKEKAKSHADMLPMHQELFAGMTSMHDGMMKGMMQADADVAFAAGMIPHHQGAVDMAKVELKYGKDADMKKLAEEIIAAQGPEIEQMSKWLEARGIDPAQFMW